MKYIIRIMAYAIIYLLLTYLLSLNIPILIKSIFPLIIVNQGITNLIDLIAAILIGAIMVFPIYYYQKQYLRVSFKLNISHLFLYVFAVLFIDYLNHSIFIYQSFEVKLIFRWDNLFFTESFFYFLRTVIIGSVVLEMLFRGILIEYLLINEIKAVWVVLISASIFGFILMFFQANFIPSFSFGLLSAFIYLRERNVVYCILLHLVWNFIGLYILNWAIQ